MIFNPAILPPFIPALAALDKAPILATALTTLSMCALKPMSPLLLPSNEKINKIKNTNI